MSATAAPRALVRRASPRRRPTISRFHIEGLFDSFDIEIPIRNNRVVLVGVNGIGKSTVINVFYYLMSRQWHRLSEFEFSSAAIDINGKTFKEKT